VTPPQTSLTRYSTPPLYYSRPANPLRAPKNAAASTAFLCTTPARSGRWPTAPLVPGWGWPKVLEGDLVLFGGYGKPENIFFKWGWGNPCQQTADGANQHTNGSEEQKKIPLCPEPLRQAIRRGPTPGRERFNFKTRPNCSAGHWRAGDSIFDTRTAALPWSGLRPLAWGP